MDPDRAAPNTGDNLTAARDFLARAAMQLRLRASKRCAKFNYDDNPRLYECCV